MLVGVRENRPQSPQPSVFACLYDVLDLRLAAFFPRTLHDELVGNQGDELAVGGLLSLVLLRSNRLIVYVFATCRILKFRLIHRTVCRLKYLLFLGVPR